MSSVTTAQNVKTTIKPVDTKIQDDHANNNQANQLNINLLMLNVCGLTNKLKFDVFTEKTTQYKIICLTEIKADEVDCITIKKFAEDHGYHCFCKPRKT